MKSFLMFAAVLPLLASAHEVRQQGPHVHGQANVQIAVDGNVVDVRLQAPGMGILAFERPPASDAETAELKRSISTLDSGKWVVLPQAAGCSMISHEVKTDGFSTGSAAAHDHDGHDDHAGHDHAGHDHSGHDHASHHHAGFEAAIQFRCRDASKLTHVHIELAAQFPNLHQTIVESATALGQNRVQLEGQQRRVELKR